MAKFILGLNIGNHDAAAALIKDGELVRYIEQERISQHKMAFGEPPVEAALECLRSEGITLDGVYAVSIGMDWKYRNQVYRMSREEAAKYAMFEDPAWFLPPEVFGTALPPIYVIKHHLAHAASAYRVSGFEECAILVTDNRGEDASTSLGYAKDGEIHFFKEINIHNSLGIFYNRAARFTGLYGKYREVGKFMGLASYGRPVMEMPLAPSRDKRLFKGLPDIEQESIFDAIELRTRQFKEYFEENCFPYETGNYEEIMGYADFAASVQKSLEDALLDFATELKETTRMDSLVLAGGVALNCSANGRIERSGIFQKMFVPPFASDSGVAVGSALEVYHRLYGGRGAGPLRSAGLGLSYEERDVLEALEKYRDRVRFSLLLEEDMFDRMARELSEGKIVGWMQGGFEAGPRALGNRSILADPRTRRSLIKLNTIKEREMWRPIAPSVLAGHYSEYFEGDPDSKSFMNVAAMVKKEKRRAVAAVVHVDHTARPQVVRAEQGKYYGLIQAFYRLTGVPVLCNTSFNSRGTPLVNSPEDALVCFLKTAVDLLVIGNIVIEKM